MCSILCVCCPLLVFSCMSSLIVNVYKGKGKKSECKNYSGIIVPSVAEKVCKVMIERLQGVMRDESHRFRKGRDCVAICGEMGD